MTVQLRLSRKDEDWAAVLALLQDAFAYMEGRIDPPSSLNRWTSAVMASEAARGFVILGEADDIVACAFARPEGNDLYLGKIAVANSHRRQGLLYQMIAFAATEGQKQNRTALCLQTRVELTENHAAFGALGFTEIARTAHEGYDRPTSITMRKLI